MNELLTPDDTRDSLRKIGGLLLGIGILMWLLRTGDEMSEFVRFVLLAAPAALFYGGGVFTDRFTGGVRPWQAVYTVFGLLFIPLALGAFVDMVGGEGSNLNTFWIAGVTAAAGFYAGIVANVRWGLLFGGLALIVSWTALWDKILSDGITQNFGVYRGLLGILAVALLAAGLYLWRDNPGSDDEVSSATEVGGDRGLWKGSELLTAAGVSAVLATGLGAFSFLANSVPFPTDTLPGTSVIWDVLLLVVSLGLVGLGSTIGVRGPVYVGAIGLLLFLAIVGGDLDDDTPEPSNFGIWPLILLITGAVAIALSSVKEASQGNKPKELVDKLKGSQSRRSQGTPTSSLAASWSPSARATRRRWASSSIPTSRSIPSARSTAAGWRR